MATSKENFHQEYLQNQSQNTTAPKRPYTITVGELAHQFLSLEPQRNPARLAFYHYLKNFLNLDLAFTQDMLDGFYDRTLMLQYWQANRQQLGETLRGDLNAIAARKPFAFEPEQVLHADQLQVVLLEQTRDFHALLAKKIKIYTGAGDKVRTFSLDKEHRTFAAQEELIIRLQKSGRFIAETHSNVAILLEGEPHLVRPHTRLIYSAELDLEPKVDQILATSLMRVARFEKIGPKLRGAFIQGTGFHRTEAFDRPLNDVPELFQAIKRVERFYVNPVSDPDYQELYDEVLEDRRANKSQMNRQALNESQEAQIRQYEARELHPRPRELT